MARSQKKTTKAISASQAETIAAETVYVRARQDIALQELTKRFEASLEAAAKKAMESIRHIDAIFLAEREPDEHLVRARKKLASVIKLIVKAGIAPAEGYHHGCEKDCSSKSGPQEANDSGSDELEDNDVFHHEHVGDNLGAGRQPIAG